MDLSKLPAFFNADTVAEVNKKFNRSRRDKDFAELDPDWEFAMVDGRVLISRYQWMNVSEELLTCQDFYGYDAIEVAAAKSVKLTVGRPGQLQSLQWILEEDSSALRGDQVEIEPRAVGLNFKDILVAMGIVQGLKPGLGLWCHPTRWAGST